MYIVYVDESGDHNLKKISDKHQILCVTACVFKNDYINNLDNILNSFKISHFGTDSVILVSRKIRRHLDEFWVLHNEKNRQLFYDDLDKIMEELEFRILSGVILKQEHSEHYGANAWNPYDLCLEFIMERLKINYGNSPTIKIIAESRGKKEDEELENAFIKIKNDQNRAYDYDFTNITELRTEKKSENINGLQIADLCAYPIGSKVLHPERESIVFDLIYPKIARGMDAYHSYILGCGLKIFPNPTDEHCQLWG